MEQKPKLCVVAKKKEGKVRDGSGPNHVELVEVPTSSRRSPRERIKARWMGRSPFNALPDGEAYSLGVRPWKRGFATPDAPLPGGVRVMDRVLLCALLLGTAASKNGSGLGPLWSSGRETTVGAPLSPQPEAAQGTPDSSRLYDCALHGPPLGDWPLLHEKQTTANDSQDAWEDAFDAAWNVVFAFLVLVFVLILTFVLCGRCLLDRITASFERLWASNNIIMRVFNRRSGNDYGAFEDTASQSPDAERSQGSAALGDAEPGCSGTPETTFTYRERTDSQATLEAEDTV